MPDSIVRDNNLQPTDAANAQDGLDNLQNQIIDFPKGIEAKNREGKDNLFDAARFVSDINKISAESRFVINDVTLSVPPTAIRIDRNNVNYRWHTLRSKNPQKVKSGHGNIQVGLTIYFVGIKAIDEGLRRLLVQLEHHPFVYVNNTYLRDNIIPGSNRNMAFTVLDFTVRTEPGLVDTLALDLDMTWFNYKPFSKDFTFRKTWEKPGATPEWEIVNGKCRKIEAPQNNTGITQNTSKIVASEQNPLGPQPVGNAVEQRANRVQDRDVTDIERYNLLLKTTVPVRKPSESIPYCTFYDSLMAKRKALFTNNKTLVQSLSFTYNEYKEVKLPANLEFLRSRTLKPGFIVPVDETNMRRVDEATMQMRPLARDDFEALAREFVRLFGKKLPITSCFRTFKQQSELNKKPTTRDLANKAGTSFHEAGLAFDISYMALEGKEYAWLVRNSQNTQVVPGAGFKVDSRVGTRDEAALIAIHKEAKENGRPIKEMWHFTHQSERNIKEVLKKIYNNEESFEQQIQRSELQKKYVNWLRDQRKGGWLDVKDFPRIFRRPRSFSLSAADVSPTPPGNKLILASMTMSMSHVVAHLPLISHQYATHQFLGSADKELYLSILSHGTSGLKEIQIMNEIIEINARIFRRVPGSTTVTVANNQIVTELFNIQKVLIESISTETLEGTPDLFAVNLRLTHFPVDTDKFFTEFVSDDSLRRKVIERLVTQISKQKVQRALDNVLPDITTEVIKYKKIPKAIGTANAADAMDILIFGDNGHLDRLIDIIESLNSAVPTEDFKSTFNVPTVKFALYGAEKLVEGNFDTIGSLSPNSTLLKSFAGNFIAGTKAIVSGIKTLLTGGDLNTAIQEGSNAAGEGVDLLQRVYAEGAREKLQALADKIIQEDIEHPFFKDLEKDVKNSNNFVKGAPAYPDLDLPAHPLTESSLDTNPDWYFWNAAEEGEEAIVKKNLENVARDFLKDSYTSYNTINDGTWYNKNYTSPNSSRIKTDGEKLTTASDGYDNSNLKTKAQKAGGSLVFSNEAKITGKRHQKLTRYNSVQPKVSAKLDGHKTEFGPINLREGEESLHDFSSNTIEKVFKESVANFRNNAHTLRRAFPTFKIYFIEDERMSGEDNKTIRKIKTFDDFYSYNAIKDLRIVRNRKIAADLAVITMTNIDGTLDDRAFYKGKKTAGIDDPGKEKSGAFNPLEVEATPNPWEAVMLQTGQKVQIRLGYSNDPNQLDIVFNGKIVEVAPSESGDLMQIVCQSYGVELVQQVKGLSVNPADVGEARDIGDTQELLSTMICEPELAHFGRWEPNPFYNPAEIQGSRGSGAFGDQYSVFTFTGLANRFRRRILSSWNFLNLPQDDNIYAPQKNTYYDAWRTVLNFERLNYYIVHTTIWDIFQEMELRHPGWVSYPQVYNNRYTMFFGVPSQRYWSKQASVFERSKIAELTEQRRRDVIWGPGENERGTTLDRGSILSDKEHLKKAAEISAQTSRFIPFRGYHLITGEHHIISNNIAIDAKNSINTAAVEFRPSGIGRIPILRNLFRDSDSGTGAFAGFERDNSRLVTVKADDNIDDQHVRMLHEAYYNCEGEYMARRYALGMLLRHMKDIYTGEICIIGNPKIKPHDICYVLDSYTDMYGPVGVEQVTHCFSFEEGFVTKIVPDLVVTGNEWYSTPLIDAIGKVATQTFGELTLGEGGLNKDTIVVTSTGLVTNAAAAGAVPAVSGITTSAAVATTVAVAPAFVLGMGIFLLGGYKILQFSQSRQPVHITPLILHGIPYIGGVDSFSHQTLWMYFKGKLRNWLTGSEDGTAVDALNNLAKTIVGFKSNISQGVFEFLARKIQ